LSFNCNCKRRRCLVRVSRLLFDARMT
jgi:hypothetical protein